MVLRAKEAQVGIEFIFETSSRDILMSMAQAFVPQSMSLLLRPILTASPGKLCICPGIFRLKMDGSRV